MRISDNLRQECMPEMVYALCKLAASNAYKRSEIQKLITLGSSFLEDFNKLWAFSEDSGFLHINDVGVVETCFCDNELVSFRSFRNAINANIFKNGESTKFNILLEWYLVQETSILGAKSAEDLAKISNIPVNLGNENYFLGFRFWVQALGFGSFHNSGLSTPLVYTTNNVIYDWLKSTNYFTVNKEIPAREFFRRLVEDYPVLKSCFTGNNINSSLSIGLRILHNSKKITLIYTSDKSDTWYLSKIKDLNTAKITDVIVRAK